MYLSSSLLTGLAFVLASGPYVNADHTGGIRGLRDVDNSDSADGEFASRRHLQTFDVWNCYSKSNGAYIETINFSGGPSEAVQACSDRRGDLCGDRSCYVTGGCDATQRWDGCSIPEWLENNPWTQYGKEKFIHGCNRHDSCYAGLSDDYWSGFNNCNDRFWDDMGGACNSVPWYENLHCMTIRSVWADAMNFDPGRTQFSDAYAGARKWAEENCSGPFH